MANYRLKYLIITPSCNEEKLLPNLIQSIVNQTILPCEWIIVDDGDDSIQDLVKDHPHVKYYRYEQKMKLGKKRNLMHEKSKGDIIVYMDDDDYYPPTRVSHAVEKLVANPNALAAGSSEMYIYFKNIDKMYQFGPYGPKHATAGTFAFKKELLDQTRYNEDKCLAEEKEFLKGFTIPFVQLEPKHVILVFSHSHNTCDKSKLIADENNAGFRLSNKTVSDFIKEPDLYEWFVNKIDDELNSYEQGLPKYKPDVLKQLAEFEERIKQRKKSLTPDIGITIQRKGKSPIKLNQDQVVKLLQEQQNKIKELMMQNKRLESLCQSQQDRLSELTNPNMKDHITQADNITTFTKKIKTT